jgi:hypothetical protein
MYLQLYKCDLGHSPVLFITLFATLVPSKANGYINYPNFGFMSRPTYILSFNSEVLWPSFNIKTLWAVMVRRCKQEGRDLPDSYDNVRRLIIVNGFYKHIPLPGWQYKIERRDLLKKSVQQKLPLNKYQQELSQTDLSKL